MGNVTGQSPIYLQIREIVRTKIEEGEYAPGTAIPSENELAERYGVHRQTVRSAIDTLAHEGLLYVLGRKMERNLDELQGFTQTMLEKHVEPSFRILTKSLRRAGEKYALLFGIDPDDEIYYIKRLCKADNEPVSLEEIFIPYYVVPKLIGIDLSIFSVYEVYEMYGIKLERARQTLDLVHLEQNDVRMLEIDPELPVMLFQCVTYDDRGRVIEFNRNYARGDKCNFSVHFKK